MTPSKSSQEQLAARTDVVYTFRQFDANGDGMIDREELGRTMSRIDSSWDQSRLDRLFRVIDINADGIIDYEEFVTWAFATPGVNTKDLDAFRKIASRMSSGHKGDPILVHSQTRRSSTSLKRTSEPASKKDRGVIAISAGENAVRLSLNDKIVENLKDNAAKAQAHGQSEAASPFNQSPLPQTLPTKTHANFSVTNMAGNEIGTIECVDITATTGRDLKRIIANNYGFPEFNMKLVLVTGNAIGNDALVAQTHFSEALSDNADENIPVCCILSTAKPLGPKEHGNKKPRFFGSKAGILLEHRLHDRGPSGNALIETLRVPDLDFRDAAQQLITVSFAPSLAPLIDVGFNAAYHAGQEDVPLEAIASDQSSGGFVYFDEEFQASADLSTCRLWTRVLSQEALEGNVRDMLGNTIGETWKQETEHQNLAFGTVVSAILWRLIFGWEGSLASARGGAAKAGPVLEVLFLATHPILRETGEARMLLKELEAAAVEMGCAAVAVAAVPGQGRNFWKSNGYTEAVPLAESEAKEKSQGPGEAVTALGDFLLDHMLLFADTPLVAKVLL